MTDTFTITGPAVDGLGVVIAYRAVIAQPSVVPTHTTTAEIVAAGQAKTDDAGQFDLVLAVNTDANPYWTVTIGAARWLIDCRIAGSSWMVGDPQIAATTTTPPPEASLGPGNLWIDQDGHVWAVVPSGTDTYSLALDGGRVLLTTS